MSLLSNVTSATAVDPNSKAAASQAKLDAQLNQFLNLLVTQLKNQDPLDPLDAKEFTSQLVQFASVEQQIYQNSNLEKLLAIQTSNQVSSMVNYLGTTVEFAGKKLPLEDGRAELTYTLPTNAQKLTLTITNGAGQVVFSTDLETEAGQHSFVWNGKDSNGIDQADGVYNFLVGGTDFANRLIDVTQTSFGRVTGASSDKGQVMLSIGDLDIKFEDVISVKETPTTPAS